MQEYFQNCCIVKRNVINKCHFQFIYFEENA